MGVSLPFKGGDVDPIKLILFMGDRNLLDQFNRSSNYYTRSAYDKLREKIRSMKNAGPKQIAGVMELMKKNLIELADKDLRRGVLGEKYMSVHPQEGYIEFRGPGDDYLSKESEIEGILENTMLRLAYAMSIAGSPDLYRREYAKKLYKVLTGYRAAEISKDVKDTRYKTKIETEGENPFMRLFADYSAGAISGDELKRQWAETVLRAEQDAGDEDEDVPMGTAQEYEVFDKDTGTDRDSRTVLDTFLAYTDDEAVRLAALKYSGKGINYGVRRKAVEPKPQKPVSRRAELAKRVTRSTKDVGEQLWRVNYHSKVKDITARSQAEAIQKAAMIDSDFGREEARARLATPQEKVEYQQKQELERQRSLQAQAGAPRPAGGGEWTGQWLIRDAQGRVLHRFGGIGNDQTDANRYAGRWLAQQGYRQGTLGNEAEVVPEMR